MAWIYKEETEKLQTYLNLSTVTRIDFSDEEGSFWIKFHFVDGSDKSLFFKTREEFENFRQKLFEKLD